MAKALALEAPLHEAFSEHLVTIVKAGLGAIGTEAKRRQVQSRHLFISYLFRHVIKGKIGLEINGRTVLMNCLECHHWSCYPMQWRQQCKMGPQLERMKGGTDQPPIVIERHPGQKTIFLR